MAETPSKRPSAGLRKFALSFSALALTLLIIWYFVADSEVPHIKMSEAAKHLTFEAIPGIFEQSEPSTNPDDYDYTARNFGLIDRSYPSDTSTSTPLTPWQRLALYISNLNSATSPSISYHLLYLGRHGQGDHNVAETYYGTAAWDTHWSKLEGNGTVTWADAHLTPVGEDQARAAHAFFAHQISDAGVAMPAPEVYVVSPLWRCLQTARLTFGGLGLPEDRPFKPVIMELCREVLGEHTCDRRSGKGIIEQGFGWEFEEGFAEEDRLWKAEHRETMVEHDLRTREFLTQVFGEGGIGKGREWVSVTSHSGTIASLLRVLGHREFPLPTGGMIPVLIKVTANVSV